MTGIDLRCEFNIDKPRHMHMIVLSCYRGYNYLYNSTQINSHVYKDDAEEAYHNDHCKLFSKLI